MMKHLSLVTALLLVMAAPALAHECLDAQADFGIAANGTDETTAIVTALEASALECVYFGAGTYAFDPTTLPAFESVPQIETAGMRLTVFKNLSATARMFEFAKHTATDFKTSFMSFGGLTIDQNGSTGTAVKAGAMFTSLQDIWVHGQAGAGWGFDLHGITQGVLRNLQITSSSNCLRLSTTYYLRADQIGCERTSGVGVLVEHSTGAVFTGLYLDNGSVAGPVAGEVLKVYNSHSIDFDGLSGEFASGADLTPIWFIKIDVSTSVNVNGGRINHTSNNGSAYIFHVVNSDFRLAQFEWEESKLGMILIGGTGNIVARDITTTGTVSGSRYGIANWDGPAQRVAIENWRDLGTPALNNYVSASVSYIRP